MLEEGEVFAVTLATREEGITLLPQMAMVIITDNDGEAMKRDGRGGREGGWVVG